MVISSEVSASSSPKMTNSTNDNQQTPLIKVWYLTPHSKNVQVIKIPKKFTYETDILPRLHCKMVGYAGFTNKKNICYGLLMNDMGLFEDTEYNEAATKILTKLPVRWGTRRLNGYYIIYSYKYNEDEENIDMDISIKEFIQQWNESARY